MQPFWFTGRASGYPLLRGRRNADVAVIGGGFTGLHTALWLCRAGLRVILLEAGRLGCGASSRCAGIATVANGAECNALSRFSDRAAMAYGQTQNAAFQSLRELASENDASHWQEEDAYLMGSGERAGERMHRMAEVLNRSGVAAAYTQATQCPLPIGHAVSLRHQGTLNPEAHLLAVAEQGRRYGLQIYERSRAIALESNLAVTERGSVLAPFLVIATGYPILNTPGWYFTRLYQRQLTLIPLERCEPFEGVYLDVDGGFAVRGLREGALFRLTGPVAGVGSDEPPLRRFDRLYGAQWNAALPEQAYGGYEVYSGDGLPYIGPYSRKTPNLFVASGYGGSGLVNSVVAAQAISARILGLPESGYELYGKEGRGRDWRLIAAQTGRFLGGELRFQAPRCPHMGCRMVYRRSSHSWECPCHGASFDDIGRVRNAPAVRDAVIARRREGRP